MNLLIMGAPGCGKGTQAEILVKELQIPTISTGAMLREAIAQGTELGNRAKSYIEAGNLVPDEVMIDLVLERLQEEDCKNGYILDGFPRTLKQAEAMENAGIHIDKVLLLEVSDDTIIRRIGGRRVCSKCGATYHVTNNPPKVEGVCDFCNDKLITRNDDAPETVRHRLETYHRQTEPAIDYYRKKGLLAAVNGVDSVEETNQRLLSALGV